MNNLLKINKLKNCYFIMRHGESIANREKIIISDPKIGIKKYGLTDKGRLQIKESIAMSDDLDNKTIIYSSDFLRTKETAKLIKEILNNKKLYFKKNLRERYFGLFDQKSNQNYQNVWLEDKKDPSHKKNNVESVDNVLNRTTSLILALEKKYNLKKILLISHGDPLQILQTAFLKISPANHRKIDHLDVAEIRELKLNE